MPRTNGSLDYITAFLTLIVRIQLPSGSLEMVLNSDRYEDIGVDMLIAYHAYVLSNTSLEYDRTHSWEPASAIAEAFRCLFSVPSTTEIYHPTSRRCVPQRHNLRWSKKSQTSKAFHFVETKFVKICNYCPLTFHSCLFTR